MSWPGRGLEGLASLVVRAAIPARLLECGRASCGDDLAGIARVYSLLITN